MRAGWRAYEEATKDSEGGFHSQLGDAAYWEELYAATPEGGQEVFDWLLNWSDLGGLLETLLARDPRRSVLHLGCGNSTLPEEMYDAGYQHQTCIDISPSVVAQMTLRNSGRPGMRWVAADCTDLMEVLADDSIDLVVDKGAFDALACHDLHALMLAKYLKEAFRVTKPGGVYLCISTNAPDNMRKWLQQRAFGWRVRAVPWVQPKEEIAILACAKRRSTRQCLDLHWPSLLRRVEERPDSDVEAEEADSSDNSGAEETLQG